MLTLLLEIHFWTFSDEIYISNNDFGAFKYHCKKENIKSLSYDKKKSYAGERDYHWSLSNKKPTKLRQNVKELEEILASHRIIRLKWLKEDLVILFFNSGTVAYISISPNGDIINVYFDKILKDKLLSLHISDILTSNIFSICCYNDPQLTLIHYSKPTFTKLHKKISDLDPRFISVHLSGPSGRRLVRKLSINKSGDVVSVWWKYSDDDVFPWSPLVKDIDRANIHLYFIAGPKVELICYHRTEHDLLDVAFSSIESHILYIVEQKFPRQGHINVEISTFEIVKCSRLQRCNIVCVPLQSNVCCVAFSPDRTNLLLGCVNGSIVLYNQVRALTHIVRTAFVPAIIRWHANGYVVVVSSIKGQLQCFDFALGPIKMQCVSEDVTPSNIIDVSVYTTQPSRPQPPSLVQMEWSPKCSSKVENTAVESPPIANDVFLLISFDCGPLVILRVFSAIAITPEFLVSQYLNAEQIDKAINVLLALDWDTSPNLCCSLLKEISNFILISSASSAEKYSQIQMALDSFYSPIRPISHSVEAEFYKSIRNISRRLFQYLLRYSLYDLAVNVATQLNEHDLFMDLYFCGKSHSNTALVAMAWQKAEQVLAEDAAAANPSSDSENCDCSCSECSCESDENSDYVRSVNQTSTVELEKLPSSSIVLPSSSRASFAAITRVNSSRSTNSQYEATHEKKENAQHNKVHANRPVKLEQPLRRIISQGKTATNSTVNITPHVQENTLTPRPVVQTRDLSMIPDKINELLHQTGLSDSKILDSKSIKVVHFGVV